MSHVGSRRMKTDPLIVSLGEPEWDILFAPHLAKLLAPAASHPDVIVDMSDVTFIDTTCLNKLIALRRARAQRGYEPERLVVPSKNIRRVFALVRFDEIWPLYDTLNEALDDLPTAKRHSLLKVTSDDTSSPSLIPSVL